MRYAYCVNKHSEQCFYLPCKESRLKPARPGRWAINWFIRDCFTPIAIGVRNDGNGAFEKASEDRGSRKPSG
jgi:hypothetical protein